MKFSFGRKKAVLVEEHGFSLIEAMVAILIFAVGILGAYKLQIHATQGHALANRVSTSTQWAGYAVEEILGKDFEDPDLADDHVSPDARAGFNGLDETGGNADGALYIRKDGSRHAAPSADDLYSVFWNVALGDNTTETSVMNDVKQIRVRVFRNGGIGAGTLYNHDYFKARWPESI